VRLAVISKLLRHKNLQTTERCLQAIDPRFRDTMKLLDGEFFGVDLLTGVGRVQEF
jgi:hypothetical protein